MFNVSMFLFIKSFGALNGIWQKVEEHIAAISSIAHLSFHPEYADHKLDGLICRTFSGISGTFIKMNRWE